MTRPPLPLTAVLVVGTYLVVAVDPATAAPLTTALLVAELVDRDDR